MSFITSQSVTVLRAARLRDDTGTLTPQSDWENATQFQVNNVSVQPVQTDENRGSGQIIPSETWRLFSARGTDIDIQVGDRVIWRGRTLDVVGNPQRWHGLPGTTHHAEILLRSSAPTPIAAAGVAGNLRQAQEAAAYPQEPWTP